MNRQAANYVNYQERANEFSVGDIVAPFGMLESWSGRITAVWPAIGMADVETPLGNRRYPVEDLQKFVNGNAVPPHTDSTPGGGGSVSVPGGPQAGRVAAAFAKKSLYWASKDRKYKMTRPEQDCGEPTCPRCEDHPVLKKVIFRRQEGTSERLLGCKTCLFLICREDVLNAEPAS